MGVEGNCTADSQTQECQMKQMANYSDGLLFWGREGVGVGGVRKDHYYACQGGRLSPSVDSASLLRGRDAKTFEMYAWMERPRASRNKEA